MTYSVLFSCNVKCLRRRSHLSEQKSLQQLKVQQICWVIFLVSFVCIHLFCCLFSLCLSTLLSAHPALFNITISGNIKCLIHRGRLLLIKLYQCSPKMFILCDKYIHNPMRHHYLLSVCVCLHVLFVFFAFVMSCLCVLCCLFAQLSLILLF